MSETTPQMPQIRTDEQNIYLDWKASPKALREPKTETELADKLGVDRKTLWRWRQISGFDKERLKRIRDYFIEDTPDIITALREKAKEGNVQAIVAWMELVEQIAKKLEVDATAELKEFYESIFGRPKSSGEVGSDSPSQTGGSGVQSSEVQNPSGGAEVRQESTGSVSGDQNPSTT